MKLEEEIKQTKFRSPQHKATLNLIYTTNWLESKQHNFFKPFGITGTQFNILRILRGQHPNKISGVEIKARMLDKNSDISRLIDRLIAKKLIDKTQCPSDKRAANIGITALGLEILKKIDKSLDETERQVMNLSDEEATELCRLLDKSRGTN